MNQSPRYGPYLQDSPFADLVGVIRMVDQAIPVGGLQETVVTGPSPADVAGQHHGAAPIEHGTLVPVGEWSQWIIASSQGNLVGAVGSRATEVPGDHQVIIPLPLDHVRCFDIGGVSTG